MDMTLLALPAIGGLVLFALLAVAVVAGLAHERAKKQMEHQERMKALELGQMLPDAALARARADAARSRTAGVVAFLGLLVPAGTALAVTYMVSQSSQRFHSDLLGGIWLGCGIIALLSILGSLRVLRRGRLETVEEEPRPVHSERWPPHKPAAPGQPGSPN